MALYASGPSGAQLLANAAASTAAMTPMRVAGLRFMTATVHDRCDLSAMSQRSSACEQIADLVV